MTDYEGVSLSSRDANSKQAASEADGRVSLVVTTLNFWWQYLCTPDSQLIVLQHRKFFVNVPTYLTWIFWLFKPIIPSATLSKMSVVGSGPYTVGKALLPLIDTKQLPKRYGGEAEAF